MRTFRNTDLMRHIFTLILIFISISGAQAQHTVAREWNELLLESIRNDFARPTIHARNIFHTSIAMYDAWAVYDGLASTYFLGQSVDGYNCPFAGIAIPADVEAAAEETMSYAMYRLLIHRFQNSPAAPTVYPLYTSYMNSLGYSTAFTSTDYSTGSPAALGNYLASQIIQFGFADGSNELLAYNNLYYSPQNTSLAIDLAGNPNLSMFNNWQPLSLDVFIDQSGNVVPFNTPPFLSPEWGAVSPFALSSNDLTVYPVGGFNYEVYHDPGPPPLCDTLSGASDYNTMDAYKWGFTLVAKWSAHLDTSDGVMLDISPASIGNISSYPTSFSGYKTFYDYNNGGDASIGHSLNPSTGSAYAPQMVLRGDYARVLAEFWADGPDSETPPGHWFTILNYVVDHPDFERRFEGQGALLNPLEWDVKSYFALAGAVHDAAIAAWGAKGYYDYIRPVSVIRKMADLGQCTDVSLANYHPGGLPLIPGFIELIVAGDPLAGAANQFVGQIKMKAWKGPAYIIDPDTDQAGVDWIRPNFWWPYQRPTFVTPPFAGYVSGHSTFSRAAAEVLTSLTGDAFFPGGMGQFNADQNQFLVFEEGPSDDVILQWATYRDASDQCSLSRIWGGIHPPADDIPGRLMGIAIGQDAFAFAKDYFEGNVCMEYCQISEVPLSETYSADILVHSNAQIQNGLNVEYHAGTSVDLEPGFEVDMISDFHAYIDSCQ